jgi:hypothetical protein
MWKGRRIFQPGTLTMALTAALSLPAAFGYEALHGPGTSFPKSANRSPSRNVVGNPHQVLRVGFSALAMCQPVQRLGHPKRTFPAGGALSATFMCVKITQVRKRPYDVRRVVHHDNRS